MTVRYDTVVYCSTVARKRAIDPLLQRSKSKSSSKSKSTLPQDHHRLIHAAHATRDAPVLLLRRRLEPSDARGGERGATRDPLQHHAWRRRRAAAPGGKVVPNRSDIDRFIRPPTLKDGLMRELCCGVPVWFYICTVLRSRRHFGVVG